MMRGPWHITRTACARYAQLREWDGENAEQATREISALLLRAHFIESDRHGRELWRSSRRDGRLRWVLDPRKVHEQYLPQVIWVGHSKPPARLWAP
jgi:hypothetical protein